MNSATTPIDEKMLSDLGWTYDQRGPNGPAWVFNGVIIPDLARKEQTVGSILQLMHHRLGLSMMNIESNMRILGVPVEGLVPPQPAEHIGHHIDTSRDGLHKFLDTALTEARKIGGKVHIIVDPSSAQFDPVKFMQEYDRDTGGGKGPVCKCGGHT